MKKPLLFMLAAAAACGGGAAKPPPPIPKPPDEPPPALRPPTRLQITVVSASIDGKKPDGSVWDEGANAAGPPELRGALASYLAAHPELEGASHLLGEPVDVPGVLKSARTSSAPDPMVFVEVGGKTFRTTLAPGQFQPVWRFPLVVTVSPDAGGMVRLTVVDWDGPGQVDVIGDKSISLKTLLAEPVTELPRFGNVERLVLEVAPASAELSTRRRVAVAGRDGWTDTGLNVVAGQEVSIRAAGEVCTKSTDRSRCAGPEGQPSAEGNLPGMEARGHGALIGAVGDTRFHIGRELRFVAPSSGPLLLGVNDVDVSNNSGEYEVLVEVK